MTERLALEEIARATRLRWWIPALLAVVGGVLGIVAADQVPKIYRADATVLVGPTQGAVTHSSTIRASEDLATFYADMARRQIVLQPVVDRLRLRMSWVALRDQVSAVVPPQNPRLVEVRVAGADQRQADVAANAVVRQLVTLSPPLASGNEQAFVNGQVANLKVTLADGNKEIARLKGVLARTTDPTLQDDVRRQIRQQQRLVQDWQKTYVDLITVEPSADAGGLQVLDHASAVTGLDRMASVKLAVVGFVLGGVLGLVIAWLLYAWPSREKEPAGDDTYWGMPEAQGTPGPETSPYGSAEPPEEAPTGGWKDEKSRPWERAR